MTNWPILLQVNDKLSYILVDLELKDLLPDGSRPDGCLSVK